MQNHIPSPPHSPPLLTPLPSSLPSPPHSPPLLNPFNYPHPFLSPSGAVVLIPVQASVDVSLGLTAVLNIYAEGDPPLASNEIEWRKSDGSLASTITRISLRNSNYQLVIQNVNLQDSGVYRILIVRNTIVLTTTAITLTVHGKCIRTSEEYRLKRGQPLNKGQVVVPAPKYFCL